MKMLARIVMMPCGVYGCTGWTHLTGDLKGEFVMEPEVTLLPARLDVLLERGT